MDFMPELEKLLDAALKELASTRIDEPCDGLQRDAESWEECAEVCAHDSPTPDCWRRYLKKKVEEQK